MPTENERNKRIDKAALKILFNVPFFAPGVARLPIEWGESLPSGAPVPTACTNGEKIIWNPEWFDTLKDEEVVTVYCEEVCHCLFGHIWRKPPSGDVGSWNKACDATVRNMLEDFSEVFKSKGMAEPFPLPDKQKLFNHKQYDNMSEEQIYRMILGQQQPQGNNGNGQGNGSGGQQGQQPKGGKGKNKQQQGQQPKGGKGKNKQQQGQGQGQGDGDPFGEFTSAPNGESSHAKNQKDHNNWKSTLIQSAHMAKSRGTIPLGIDRMIGEMINPEVPWQELLRAHLREVCSDDWDWMKPDLMMSDATSFIMPSLNSECMSQVIFGIDTSGSIDLELLKSFKTEEQSCLDDMKPSKLIEICCDSNIQRIKEYRVGDQIDGNAPGGGGTTLSEIFNHIDEQQEQPKCLVILTDLETDFPKNAPQYPVIWLVYGNDAQAPFGLTIKVK